MPPVPQQVVIRPGVGRGSTANPFKVLTDEEVIHLTKIKLPERGYHQITYHTNDGNELTCWRPQYGLG